MITNWLSKLLFFNTFKAFTCNLLKAAFRLFFFASSLDTSLRKKSSNNAVLSGENNWQSVYFVCTRSFEVAFRSSKSFFLQCIVSARKDVSSIFRFPSITAKHQKHLKSKSFFLFNSIIKHSKVLIKLNFPGKF